jgi:glycosyltransferase involved in cell wall biosynthesis
MKNNSIKKLTLTVAIPAYNEEKNIANILKAVISQSTKNFVLQKIIVYSDVSTDNTHSIIESFRKKYPLITLRKGTKRKGKYMLVNEAFKECITDVLIVLDADIALVGNHFLEKLVNVIQTDPKALLVASHQILLRPKTFIGKVVYTNFLIWDNVRWSIPNYDSPHNFYASATAFRGSFARSVTIPSTLSDAHLYIYLKAAEQKGFRYCREAEILQWPITTLKDFNKFLNRAIGKRDKKLEEIFGPEVRNSYALSRKYKLLGILKSFKQEPFYTPLSFLLTIYMKIKPKKKTKIWEIVTSTKKPINL